jgi:hypothetical protein
MDVFNYKKEKMKSKRNLMNITCSKRQIMNTINTSNYFLMCNHNIYIYIYINHVFV